MTPSRVDETEESLRLRAKRGEAPDFGLWAQREGSPEVARAVVLGAGQAARRAARARGHAKLERTYATLCLALAASPDGLTRKELAHATAIPVNTVNARIAELRGMPEGDKRRVITHGRRNGESIVYLASLRVAINEGEG